MHKKLTDGATELFALEISLDVPWWKLLLGLCKISCARIRPRRATRVHPSSLVTLSIWPLASLACQWLMSTIVVICAPPGELYSIFYCILCPWSTSSGLVLCQYLSCPRTYGSSRSEPSSLFPGPSTIFVSWSLIQFLYLAWSTVPFQPTVQSRVTICPELNTSGVSSRVTGYREQLLKQVNRKYDQKPIRPWWMVYAKTWFGELQRKSC